MKALLQKKGFICDMDGVIYHGDRLLPGVREFVDWLYAEKKEFLFLTNNSAANSRCRRLRASICRLMVRFCSRRRPTRGKISS